MIYEVIFTVEVNDQDSDLKTVIPDVIRDRFNGTAVRITEISIKKKEEKAG